MYVGQTEAPAITSWNPITKLGESLVNLVLPDTGVWAAARAFGADSVTKLNFWVGIIAAVIILLVILFILRAL